jgi:hypothetical protein
MGKNSEAQSLAELLGRDLGRLRLQIEAFGDSPELWQSRPSAISNSAGNLTLHLEGNLSEYIGRQLGGYSFVRNRPWEFSATGLPVEEMLRRIDDLTATIPPVVEQLRPADLDRDFPESVLGFSVSTRQLLIHLYGHFNYHLGQIDILRRSLLGRGAISYPAMR